jgi:hypothetical protein
MLGHSANFIATNLDAKQSAIVGAVMRHVSTPSISTAERWNLLLEAHASCESNAEKASLVLELLECADVLVTEGTFIEADMAKIRQTLGCSR